MNDEKAPPERGRLRAAALTLALPWLADGQAWAQAASPAGSPALTPALHFFRNPLFGDPELSPDGKRLAFLVAEKEGFTRLAVLDLQTMKPTVVASYDEADVDKFQWVNDQRLVFSLWSDYAGQGLFGVNADGSGYRQLVDSLYHFVSVAPMGRAPLPPHTFLIGSASRQDNEFVYVWSPEEYNKQTGAGYLKFQKLNTVNGAAEDLSTPQHTIGLLIDSRGELRAAYTERFDKGTVQVRQPDGRWLTVTEYNPRDIVQAAAFPTYLSPEGSCYARALADGDKEAIYRYDLGTGKVSGKPVLQSKDFDLRPRFVANDDKLLGIRYAVDAEATLWLDPNVKALQASIDQLLPDTINRLSVARRATLPFVLVSAYSDKRPATHMLYNTDTKRLVRLGASHPDIKPTAMGQMDMVRYKARDGLEIPAYLTVPPGPGKNLPLVVLVHGGPWSRGETWGWDAEVQFLVSRGYAVLQPEFRGSTGFGLKHFKAGWNQWGLAMQNDLADGAKWAVAQGIADPKRIAIAGASYGGYAAMMGLVNDPDIFRCAVNWVGVTDIDLMFTVDWSDVSEEGKRYGYGVLIGDPKTSAEQFKATSPLQQAARIKKPVLMAYGEWDRRVPLVHGEKMRDALKAHNPNVEWVVYKKEGHGWGKVSTKLDFWGRVEAFLAKNLAAS